VAAVAALTGCEVGQPWFEYRLEPAGTPRPVPSSSHEPELTVVLVAPLETTIGNKITLSASAQSPDGDVPSFLWHAVGGVIAEPQASDTTYTCLTEGQRDITVRALARGGSDSMSVSVVCSRLDSMSK
jgi:hypothetical protein